MSLNIGQNLRLWFFYSFMEMTCGRYTAISRKVVGKNVHATIPKGNMGYNQYTVPDDCSCRTFFCCFPLALANTFPWPVVPILSNFFEKQRTQNHPQCLSRLSRELFLTTFLEIAVYSLHHTSDYGNHTRRLYTAGQLQIVYHALAFFSHETNFVKFRCVKNFICVTKPLLYMNLVTPLSCFYQKFIPNLFVRKLRTPKFSLSKTETEIGIRKSVVFRNS